MVVIANLIDKTLKNYDNKEELRKIKKEVVNLMKNYPLYI